MAGLLDPERRRKARRERGERKQRLLQAARQSILSRPYTELTLESLDRSAGLREGAASMYFGSLEGLVLRLLRDELEDWLAGVEAEVRKAEEGRQFPELAELLATSLAGRRLLRRLLALLPLALDRRTVEMDGVHDVELWRLGRLTEAGELLARRYPALPPAEARDLLRRALVLSAAVEPLAQPPSGMALAISDPDLAPLYPDSDTELRILLRALVHSTLGSTQPAGHHQGPVVGEGPLTGE